MAAQQFNAIATAAANNNKNRLASKLRQLTKKMLKPVASLLMKRSSSTAKPAQTKKRAEAVEPQLNAVCRAEPAWWSHPSNLKESQYVAAAHQHANEANENLANEALEAKLNELIINECSQHLLAARQNNRANRAISLKIQGHLTILPSSSSSSVSTLDPTMQLAATFWTGGADADADLCWRDAVTFTSRSYTSTQQKAERQTAVSY